MEDRYWLVIAVVVFILALFLWSMWDASRHHHRWAKWGDPKLVEVYINGKPSGGQARFQERYCETCGEGESRRMNP